MPANGQPRGPTEAEYAALVDRLAALERRQAAGGARADQAAATQGGQRAQRGDRAAQRRATADGHGGRARSRPGDWRCAHCQAYPCFGRTETCYRCGTRRQDQGDGAINRRSGADRGLAGTPNRGQYLGPVGAGGARPLLGGRGAAQAGGPAQLDRQQRRPQAPSYRVPGASLAAHAEAEARRTKRSTGGDPATDGEEFRAVQRGAPPSMGTGTAAGGRPVTTANSWAALTEEEDAMDQEGDGDEEATDGDGNVSPPEAEVGPGGTGRSQGTGGDGHTEGHGGAAGDCDEHALRLQWDEHVRACRRLERDPAMPASIIDKARALRDEAEQRWRSARTPHPLSKRMRWAGADLRAAEEKEEVQRRELQLHIEEAARRTRELEARVQVAADRTARKRAALQELLAEGVPADVPPQDKWPMALAATAVTGIAQSIAPPLAAAIERLSAPLEGDSAEEVRQELQLAAASLGNLEQLLRGKLLPTVPLGAAAAHFDISGGDAGAGAGGDDGDARDDGDGKRRALSTGGPGATAAARWTKAAGKASWTRDDSSAMAVEEARRLLGAQDGGAAAAAAQCTTHQRMQSTAASSSSSGGPAADSAAATATALDPAGTNDLAVAERRAREASELQMRQALQQQQLQQSLEQQQLEEQQRVQRQQRQQEEQRRHQLAMEQAAATRAAEEARQREEAFAKLSPEERERARALHAQHEAVGAQAFGTQAASHLAGLVHRSHVQSVIRGAADGNAQENVDFLMSLTPEEFAEYEHQQMGRGGVP